MPKSIVFRVRKRYFDDIVAGKKKFEYRRDSPFWRKRLEPLSSDEDVIAVFICGKRVHRREFLRWERVPTPLCFSEQGKKDVDTPMCFKIHLGEEVIV